MTKLNLNLAQAKGEILSKAELKTIYGGTGSGIGSNDGSGGSGGNDGSTTDNCEGKQAYVKCFKKIGTDKNGNEIFDEKGKWQTGCLGYTCDTGYTFSCSC